MVTARNTLMDEWYETYPHLMVLILSASSLPRPLQEAIGQQLASTIERCWRAMNQSRPKHRLCATPYWNYYLERQQGPKWSGASPALHHAFNRITGLPPSVLTHLNRRCDNLVNYLCVQIITGTIHLMASERLITECLLLDAPTLKTLLDEPVAAHCA
jgi:hypothetical protein